MTRTWHQRVRILSMLSIFGLAASFSPAISSISSPGISSSNQKGRQLLTTTISSSCQSTANNRPFQLFATNKQYTPKKQPFLQRFMQGRRDKTSNGREFAQTVRAVMLARLQWFLRARTKLQRVALILATSAILWMGAFSQPSHAATRRGISSNVGSNAAAITRVVEPVGWTATIDEMVDREIQAHMFDDDCPDPVESAYREAFEDYVTKGSYPRELRDAMGGGGIAAAAGNTNNGAAGLSRFLQMPDFGALIASAIRILQQKGLTESQAIFALAAVFVIAGPSSFLFAGMVVGGMSKRNMNKLMKQRYGDTYTVDATERSFDDVEAPDDDDEDDEDDGDDNDDDDDDGDD